MTIKEIKSSGRFKGSDIIFDVDYNTDNYIMIDKNIIYKLRDKGVSKNTLVVLFFCISEAMDNTLCHGNIDHGHIIVAISKSIIRILVYDEGDGIYDTFKSMCSPNVSKIVVLKMATMKASTSDDGCGNGLYAWVLASKNLHSYFDITTNDITLVPNLNYYYYICRHKGTILDLEIPINTNLSWKEILNDSLFDSIEDNYEIMIEGGNDGEL